MTTSQLAPGTIVDNRYTVRSTLRSRVGATMYEVAVEGDRRLGLTVFAPECFPSSLVLERGLRELRQLERLKCQRMLEVHGAGKYNGGVYEAHDLPPGPSLSEHLASGPLNPTNAAEILMQVGEALLEAQHVGVIHRELGADVVFPSPHGVFVGGFAVGEPHSSEAMGALDTIAPEQVEGKIVDQRTLVYNLASLMHRLLTGRPLFEGEVADVLQQHLHGDLPSSLHPGLRRALSKDPRMRPMLLKQFLRDLANLGGIKPPEFLISSLTAPAAATKPVAAAPEPVAPTDRNRGWTIFSSSDASAPAPAVAKPASDQPSTRGWTMFMQAEEEQEEPAAASASSSTSPSTRGWTMFTRDDDENPGASATLQTPPPDESPAAPASTEAVARPSTRGWTMFMTEDEPSGASESSASQQAQPISAEPQAKPTTRGWTMFMTEDEGQGHPQAVAMPEPEPAKATEAIKPAQMSKPQLGAPGPDVPVPLASEATTAAVPGRKPLSSTAPTRPSQMSVTTDGKVPSARGWTMFVEPPSTTEGAKPDDKTVPVASAGTVDDPRSIPTSPPSAKPGPDAPSIANSKPKRGWTVFMDTPLPGNLPRSDAPAADHGKNPKLRSEAPTVPVQTSAERAEPANSPPHRGAFGAPASAASAPSRADSARHRTIIAHGGFAPPTAGVPRPGPIGFAEPPSRARSEAAAPGVPAEVPAETSRSRNSITYFHRGGTADDTSAPVATVEPEDFDAQLEVSTNRPGTPAPIVVSSGSGSKRWIIAIGTVIAFGAAAAAAVTYLV